MAPTRASIKRKKCCVPYCNNVQEMSKKQFFKIGANLEGREKWLSSVGKTIAAKSQILFCCEDHFDLPNDAENYIRCKYISGTKLKLRPNVLPQKKLPLNVCRLCLKLIFNADDFVDISKTKGGNNSQIIAATLPELDLSITVEPVACVKCFEPLEQYYRIKQNSLNSEVIVVNCIKSILKRSPTRLIKNCEIDLFEEYNDIVELLEKNEKSKSSGEPKTVQDHPKEMLEDEQEADKSIEEIVIQIEGENDVKYHNNEEFEIGDQENILKSSRLRTLLEVENDYTVMESPHKHKVVENRHGGPSGPSKNISIASATPRFTIQEVNLSQIQNISSNFIGRVGGQGEYEVVGHPVELSSENMHIDVEKKSLGGVEISSSQL